MKFMKLGSKPDSFQTDGDKTRCVTSEVTTDIVVNVSDVKFHLHKFPLLSKSAKLQKLVSTTGESSDQVYIEDIPGGPAAFEMCAKFCYGMTVTLNAYNVVAARCAAEYLEMYETVEKGNLVYKIEVFLNSSIFRSWKDSIIVLQTARSLLPWSEELKVVSHCLESIASRASIDTSKVEWSYTYNRKKHPFEDGNDPHCVRKSQMVPKDWWVEDLCELHIDLFKRVISAIQTKGKVSGDVIGEALSAYALRRLPGFSKGMIQGGDLVKYRSLVETIVLLLPTEKKSVPCSFLLKLLRAVIMLECGEMERKELMRKIGQQLDEAKVADLIIQSPKGETTIYDVEIVQNLVQEFLAFEQSAQKGLSADDEFEIKSQRFISDASKGMVAKLVDGYLAEISRDPNLSPSKFVDLAEMVSSFPRPSHDGIYRAIDMYLKEHPGISKSERKRICKLMDSRKLSAEACMHAVQNERLPLRVVVQVLFFEQARAESRGSSRSATTNTEEEWDSVPTAEEIKALKGELAGKNSAEKGKMKGVTVSKIFSKLWSSKERQGDGSSSDTSESPASTNADETKSTPSRSRRHSVS